MEAGRDSRLPARVWMDSWRRDLRRPLQAIGSHHARSRKPTFVADTIQAMQRGRHFIPLEPDRECCIAAIIIAS